MTLPVACILIFIITLIMTMSGRGGGNFYVLILVASGIAMHQAASTGQFILIVTSLASSIVFQKRKVIDWKLALILEPPTIIMAFFGGYYAYFFSGMTLKLILSCLLVLASFLMLYPEKERSINTEKHFGFWSRSYGEYTYKVNLWIAIPVTAITGFVVGMVGLSGGSFKVPLMVLACGVPMKIAVGTSSTMIGLTALTGFLGHTAQQGFNLNFVIPLAVVAAAGAIIGARILFKVKPENLKKIFAYTTLGAAIFMFINAFLSK